MAAGAVTTATGNLRNRNHGFNGFNGFEGDHTGRSLLIRNYVTTLHSRDDQADKMGEIQMVAGRYNAIRLVLRNHWRDMPVLLVYDAALS